MFAQHQHNPVPLTSPGTPTAAPEVYFCDFSPLGTGISVILLHWKQLLAARPSRVVMEGPRKFPVVPGPAPAFPLLHKLTFPSTAHSLFSLHISLFTKNRTQDAFRVGRLRHPLNHLSKSTNLSVWNPAELSTTISPDPAPVPCPGPQDQLCSSQDNPDCYQALSMIICDFRGTDGSLSKDKTCTWQEQTLSKHLCPYLITVNSFEWPLLEAAITDGVFNSPF